MNKCNENLLKTKKTLLGLSYLWWDKADQKRKEWLCSPKEQGARSPLIPPPRALALSTWLPYDQGQQTCRMEARGSQAHLAPTVPGFWLSLGSLSTNKGFAKAPYLVKDPDIECNFSLKLQLATFEKAKCPYCLISRDIASPPTQLGKLGHTTSVLGKQRCHLFSTLPAVSRKCMCWGQPAGHGLGQSEWVWKKTLASLEESWPCFLRCPLGAPILLQTAGRALCGEGLPGAA